jgi:hypothetical protein
MQRNAISKEEFVDKVLYLKDTLESVIYHRHSPAEICSEICKTLRNVPETAHYLESNSIPEYGCPEFIGTILRETEKENDKL